MKKGAFFVNVGRGAVANEEALYNALKSGSPSSPPLPPPLPPPLFLPPPPPHISRYLSALYCSSRLFREKRNSTISLNRPFSLSLSSLFTVSKQFRMRMLSSPPFFFPFCNRSFGRSGDRCMVQLQLRCAHRGKQMQSWQFPFSRTSKCCIVRTCPSSPPPPFSTTDLGRIRVFLVLVVFRVKILFRPNF